MLNYTTPHHTTPQTIIQLAMGDIVTADRTFLEHLSDSHYIISQECRLAETFLNALKNRDADLVSTIRAVCSVLYCPVLYCTVLYCTVLHCTVLYCTVLYCTVLYCTVLYCTVLYVPYVLHCTCCMYCTVLHS